MQLSSPLSEADGIFANLPDVIIEQSDHMALSIRFDRFRTTATEIVKQVLQHGEIADFHLDEPGIEQIIKRVYDGNLDADALAGSAKGA
ncbi:hypothetical protein D3C72_1583790 [compost metagenome]